MKTIFERIIDKELPAEVLFENERIIAIKDKYPIAPVHILIISKKVIKSIQDIKKEDLGLIPEMIEVAQNLADEFHIANGYRLLTNTGPSSGQTIFHLHFHLIGGRELGTMG
ncbi:MAG: HIT domain-containing protein [Chlamydiae bacterium]|nr:HIT domain-containing protein [Chlamydiota bacterium]